jgi:hypothetical protein
MFPLTYISMSYIRSASVGMHTTLVLSLYFVSCVFWSMPIKHVSIYNHTVSIQINKSLVSILLCFLDWYDIWESLEKLVPFFMGQDSLQISESLENLIPFSMGQRRRINEVKIRNCCSMSN